ncbi:MAG: hypothetical protein GF368_03875 [Candidatus Aenigmarchaeota archaeon]|nr:hypothetical protein [Candidatus Aenigmarchaeota archaeon]
MKLKELIEKVLLLIKRRELKEKFLIKLFRFYFRVFPRRGLKVLKKNWDVLIVLDACRYDIFKEVCREKKIKGELHRVSSVGSSTIEWVKKNFETDCSDIVYYSSNPYVSKYLIRKTFGKRKFYDIIPVWDFGWDEELKTVPPEKVNEAFFKYCKDYPSEKKAIIHYMQPHHPFIADKESMKLIQEGWKFAREERKGREIRKKTIWDKIRKGDIPIEVAFRSYKKNLELVLDSIEDLSRKIEGKIVITSDHGNCFGEKGLLEHPYGVHINELKDVPWFILEK